MIKVLSKISSTIIHPLLVPSYTTLVYVYLFEFNLNLKEKLVLLLTVAFGTLLLPLFTALILYIFQFLNSMDLKRKSERVLPIFSSGVYAFITARILMNLPYGSDISTYMIGIVVSLSLLLLILRNVKSSLHSTAISSFVGFFIFIGIKYGLNTSFIAILGLTALAVTATARLIYHKHYVKDIYFGMLIGFIPQILMVLLD